MVQAVRGAVQISEDNSGLIEDGVRRMVVKIIEGGAIPNSDIISIQFSVTGDLKSMNPATALRSKGFADIPLFCALEPEIDGMLPRVVRTLITFNTENKKDTQPVYLDGARKLRPDLFE